MEHEREDIIAKQIAILQKQLDKQFHWLAGIVGLLVLITYVAIISFIVWLFS